MSGDPAPLGVWQPPGGFDADGGAPPDVVPTVERTDLGNARTFAGDHGEEFRYIAASRRWHVWRDGRWRLDEDDAVMRAAKATADRMLREAVSLDGDARKPAVMHALASQSEPAMRRMLGLARSEPELALAPGLLNADPWLLTCANGTLDLRSGELRDHDPDDLISLGTDVAYMPDAVCPRWQRFLIEVFDGDEDLIGFVQRAIGYSLTGDVGENAFFILHGDGANGKTTLVETVKKVIGDFAMTARFATIAKMRDDGGRAPRNDIARLHPARFVAIAESGEGRRLDEETVKGLISKETIAARFLYGEEFQFEPRFKIWLTTNHLPKITGTDTAIWRRIRRIPFDVSFLGREDKQLADTLQAELPGILAWGVEGCAAWQADGLGDTPAVSKATAEYREEEDVLGAFLAECCELERAASVPARDLCQAFDDYCRERGERAAVPGVLGKEMKKRGFKPVKQAHSRRYIGLRLNGAGDGMDTKVGNSPMRARIEEVTGTRVPPVSAVPDDDGIPF